MNIITLLILGLFTIHAGWTLGHILFLSQINCKINIKIILFIMFPLLKTAFQPWGKSQAELYLYLRGQKLYLVDVDEDENNV